MRTSSSLKSFLTWFRKSWKVDLFSVLLSEESSHLTLSSRFVYINPYNSLKACSSVVFFFIFPIMGDIFMLVLWYFSLIQSRLHCSRPQIIFSALYWPFINILASYCIYKSNIFLSPYLIPRLHVLKLECQHTRIFSFHSLNYCYFYLIGLYKLGEMNIWIIYHEALKIILSYFLTLCLRVKEDFLLLKISKAVKQIKMNTYESPHTVNLFWQASVD